MSVNPRPPKLRAANYDEPATFGDLVAIFKYLIENHVRYSLSSPPLLKDVKEGQIVWDKTLSRIYICSNGALKFVQFT
jgi:hypothetical protein